MHMSLWMYTHVYLDECCRCRFLSLWPCIRIELVGALTRSEFLFRDRFNLGSEHRNFLVEDGPAAPVAPASGSPFAVAWRNMVKSMFHKGYMYRLSCKPSAVLYIAENKTLAGKEDRKYEGEALGRKMAVVFFEDMDGPGDLVRQVNRESHGLHQVLLTIAEVLQTIGGVDVPADPERTASDTELLYERLYEDLEIQRFTAVVEPAAPDPHVFHLEGEVNAEIALAMEVPADHRTKMILSRCLQRNGELHDGETLQDAWNTTLASLKARTAHLLPAPPPPPAPAHGPAAAPAGRGRGRGRGRGALPAPPPAALAPAPAPAPPAAPAGRGGGRGRAPGGRGRGRARG